MLVENGYRVYIQLVGEIMNNYDLINEVLGKTSEEIQKMSPINILLVGKTGVGKSTLINGMFRDNLVETGVGKPVTKYLQKITKENIPINLYDTQGLELNSQNQREVLTEITTLLKDLKRQGEKDRIHLVYYCINSNGSRIEDSEISLINSLKQFAPVIIVLTQSLGENSEKLKEYIQDLKLDVADVIEILAKPYRINDMVIEEKGLKELMTKSFELLDEEIKNSFINAQHVDIDLKAKTARRWAKRYIKTAFGIGFVPIPFSDASILVPMQIGMIAHINSIFGISMDKQRVASIIAAIGGTGGATFAGRFIVTNALKFIPGIGSLAGGLISAATASIMTTALAMSYIEVLSYIAKREKLGINMDFSEIEKLMQKTYTEYLKNRKKKDDE